MAQRLEYFDFARLGLWEAVGQVVAVNLLQRDDVVGRVGGGARAPPHHAAEDGAVRALAHGFAQLVLAQRAQTAAALAAAHAVLQRHARGHAVVVAHWRRPRW